MTLAERKAEFLDRAMELSVRRQRLAEEAQRVDREMLETSGAIDLLTALIAEADGGQ